jgi:hypothetical protein
MTAGMPPQFPPTLPSVKARKSRRGLWITLGVVLVVLIALVGGGLFAFAQFIAPATAAGVFCGELKVQNYTAAYNLLDKHVQSQFTREQFSQGSQALDQVEGKVTGCGAASGSNAYSYSLGSSTASARVTIARATAGTLSGAVHLKNENGAWKVDALDTSLLGVNLGALKTAGAFCAALASQDYAGTYALLGAQAQAAVNAANFALAGEAHDAIDGNVSACGLTGLGQGNSDTAASLVVGITRGKLGAKQGSVTLDIENGAWKITAIDAALQGTDIGPVAVSALVCADVIGGNLTDVYQNLASTALKANVAQADINAFFQLNAGQTYTNCAPDYSTYKVSGSQASFDVKFTIQSSSGSVDVPVTMGFVLENGAWKLDSLNVKSA